MAVSPRAIKRRLKSVRSTRKIMKAMELVASSKVRKTTQLTVAARPYANAIRDLARTVASHVRSDRHPLLAGHGRPAAAHQELVVLVASDRGLCGGFNNQIIRKAMEFIKTRDRTHLRIVTVGRRAEQAARRVGLEIVAAFPSISNAPAFERSRPVGEFLTQEFLSGRVDVVHMVYTHFQSTFVLVPSVVQLLPILDQDLKAAATPLAAQGNTEEDTWEDALDGSSEMPDEVRSANDQEEDVFEPDPDRVLAELLPRLLEATLYRSLLESASSEHSARMMAMRNAADSAKDMVQDLTLTLNQARQSAITREISEISAGKAALE